MKIIKFTPVQLLRLDEAQRHLSAVLREVKQERLEGRALMQMKTLEDALSGVEVVKMSVD